MRRTISETERRRAMQIAYNIEHGLVPTALNKSKEKIMESTKVADGDTAGRQLKYTQEIQAQLAAEPVQTYLNPKELEARMKATKKAMEKAAKELDFIEAARYRGQLKELEQQLKK